MRFPSFIRLPRHERFTYEPRYYDPIKEDVERRVSLAKKQHFRESNELGYERISAQWKRNERISKKASITQLLILSILICTLVAYFYLGNLGIYIILGIFALAYIIFKFRKVKSTSKNTDERHH